MSEHAETEQIQPEERKVCRWHIDLEYPLKEHGWEVRVGTNDKNEPIWAKDERKVIELTDATKKSFIEDWYKVLLESRYDNKRAVSTLARHYNQSIKALKTFRARINNEYEKITGKKGSILLPELPDFNPREQQKIDEFQRKKKEGNVKDMFDALPESLRARAMALLDKTNEERQKELIEKEAAKARRAANKGQPLYHQKYHPRGIEE